MDLSVSLINRPCDEARSQFEVWVNEVRTPAEEKSEGVRTIQVSGAKARYEVARIGHEKWAIRISLEFSCGNFGGVGIPWTVLESREDCIAFFLSVAWNHFDPDRSCSSESVSQLRARSLMSAQLAAGLFGFIEPQAGN